MRLTISVIQRVAYVYRLESRPQKKRRLSDANDLNKRESPAAICDCRKDHPDLGLDPKEAKQITKRTIAALTEAVLEIEHLGED